MDQERLHKSLLKQGVFPNAQAPVEFRETHVSRLYFVGDLVYKMKKPVDFGFLNFTSLDRRRFYCQEEVRLNQRLCPEIYLGIREIRQDGKKLRINGRGKIVDYAVVMKRLPEEQLLSHLLALNDPSLPEKMVLLAHRIADFHEKQEAFTSVTGSHLEVIRENWRENFSQTAPFIRQTILPRAYEILQCHVKDFLREKESLLLRREKEGFVRDGHGDLHCQHICFTESICIYDCIEFNSRFRIADVLADLAFLLMDLEFRHRPDLAEILLKEYFGGNEQPEEITSLLNFYKIYRAWVRGKVESFLAGDSAADPRTRQEAADKAGQYFNLSLGYLCQPALIITCGLMGSGKTTLGKALSRGLRGKLLRSDLIRKDLAGLSPGEKQLSGFKQGIYSPEFSRRTYDKLLQTAIGFLDKGQSVIVDAAFTQSRQRELFRKAARELGLPFLILYTTCDRETTLERLDHRQAAGEDASDGRREIYDQQSSAFETPIQETDVFQSDTGAPLADNVSRVLCALLEKTAREGQTSA